MANGKIIREKDGKEYKVEYTYTIVEDKEMGFVSSRYVGDFDTEISVLDQAKNEYVNIDKSIESDLATWLSEEAMEDIEF